MLDSPSKDAKACNFCSNLSQQGQGPDYGRSKALAAGLGELRKGK